MPRLWTETIEGHRRAVRDATLDAAAALVAEQGLASVTMARIAERTGIGRATLYKYFPDVESVLSAWHERQIAQHLQHLVDVRDAATDAGDRLETVLLAYARMSRHGDGSEVAALLHRGRHVAAARHHLADFLGELLKDAGRSGQVRSDVPPGELAAFVLAALSAAGSASSDDTVRRLVEFTLAGLRPTS